MVGRVLRVYTIGFTKKSAADFFELLRGSGAKRLVDVRLSNASQLAGFAKKDDLAYFLDKICRMKYVHLPELAPPGRCWTPIEKNIATGRPTKASFSL